MVAPTNSRPPAVAMAPPRGSGVPVFGTPSASSSANEPNGSRQAISPVFTFTARISPHGGVWQGHFFAPSQNLPPKLVGALSGPTRLNDVPSAFGTILFKLPKS